MFGLSALNTILLVVWLISGIVAIASVLMHSGKGTGVSDMIAGSMYSAVKGAGVWEKNLDRLSIGSILVFVATLLAMALTFPLGSI